MKNRQPVQHHRLSQRRALADGRVKACLCLSYMLLFGGLIWIVAGLIDGGIVSALFRGVVTAVIAPIPCVGFIHHVHDTEF